MGLKKKEKKKENYSCGLTLAGCQVSTKATPSLSSSAEQGRENIRNVSWFKIKAGKDDSPGKADSAGQN